MDKLKSALSFSKKNKETGTIPLPPTKPTIRISPVPSTPGESTPPSFWRPGPEGEIHILGTVGFLTQTTDPILISSMTIAFTQTRQFSHSSSPHDKLQTHLASETLITNSFVTGSIASEFYMVVEKNVVDGMESFVESKVEFGGEVRVVRVGYSLSVVVTLDGGEVLVQSVDVPWVREKFDNVEKMSERQLVQTNGSPFELDVPKALYPAGFMPTFYRFRISTPGELSTLRLKSLKLILKERLEIGSAIGEGEFTLGVWEGGALSQISHQWTPVSIPTPPWGYKSTHLPNHSGINPSGKYTNFTISHTIYCISIIGKDTFFSTEQPIIVLPISNQHFGPARPNPNAVMPTVLPYTVLNSYNVPGVTPSVIPNSAYAHTDTVNNRNSVMPTIPPNAVYTNSSTTPIPAGVPHTVYNNVVNAAPGAVVYRYVSVGSNQAQGTSGTLPINPIPPIIPTQYPVNQSLSVNLLPTHQIRPGMENSSVNQINGTQSVEDEELRRAIEESEMQFALEESKRLEQESKDGDVTAPEQSTSNVFADP